MDKGAMRSIKRLRSLSRAACESIILLSVVQLTRAEDASEHLDRAKAEFLCDWRRTLPAGNNKPLDVCSDPTTGIGTIRVQTENWWGYWFEYGHGDLDSGTAMRNAFESDWEHYGKPEFNRVETQKRLAKERTAQRVREERRAEEEREFAASLSSKTPEQLCDAVALGKSSDLARSELRRRHALTDKEWALVDAGKVAIGMSELALNCSWGRGEINRTVTPYGVHIQHVYSSGYVYTENGIVTSLQDHKG